MCWWYCCELINCVFCIAASPHHLSKIKLSRLKYKKNLYQWLVPIKIHNNNKITTQDVDEPNQEELIAENKDAALRDADSAAEDISRRAVDGLLCWTWGVEQMAKPQYQHYLFKFLLQTQRIDTDRKSVV